MSEENEGSNVERLKALHGGNRLVVTKVEKEVLTIIREGLEKDAGEIVDLNIRLNSLKITLWDKLLYFKELDSKLLESCSNSDIARGIKETTLWETRIHEALSQIEEFIKGRYSCPKVPAVAGASSVSGTEDIVYLRRQGLAHEIKFSTHLDIKMEFFRHWIGSVHLW